MLKGLEQATAADGNAEATSARECFYDSVCAHTAEEGFEEELPKRDTCLSGDSFSQVYMHKGWMGRGFWTYTQQDLAVVSVQQTLTTRNLLPVRPLRHRCDLFPQLSKQRVTRGVFLQQGVEIPLTRPFHMRTSPSFRPRRRKLVESVKGGSGELIV